MTPDDPRNAIPETLDDLAQMNNGPTKRRVMNQLKIGSTACFHSNHLRPWMRTYAEWLALQPGKPGWREKIAIVNRIAHDKVSKRAVRFLEARADFIAYYDKFATGAQTAARAKLESETPWYVEQHRLGLEAAISKGDHKAIPTFTTPILERVWPRREGPMVATQVTIHLSPRQQADLSQPPAELLDAEIVEDPPA
jgi:hypothetical protein